VATASGALNAAGKQRLTQIEKLYEYAAGKARTKPAETEMQSVSLKRTKQSATKSVAKKAASSPRKRSTTRASKPKSP
jgi:hypothetical protein